VSDGNGTSATKLPEDVAAWGRGGITAGIPRPAGGPDGLAGTVAAAGIAGSSSTSPSARSSASSALLLERPAPNAPAGPTGPAWSPSPGEGAGDAGGVFKVGVGPVPGSRGRPAVSGLRNSTTAQRASTTSHRAISGTNRTFKNRLLPVVSARQSATAGPCGYRLRFRDSIAINKCIFRNRRVARS
jgi:hypothetical protein